METLTRRQFEVIRLAAAGMTNAEIGAELGIGPESVKTHLSVAYRKLGVRNRIEAVNTARSSGYFERGDKDWGADGVRP